MTQPRKWLEVPIRKRWQRRILVVAQFTLLLSLLLLGPRIGFPPYSLSFSSGYVAVFLLALLLSQLYTTRTSQTGHGHVDRFFGWPKRSAGPLPDGTMDERDLALRDAAYVLAYNVLYVSLSVGVAAYFFLGGHVREVFKSFLPLVCLGTLPVLALLPHSAALWIEPDWLEDSKRATLPPIAVLMAVAAILFVVLEFHVRGSWASVTALLVFILASVANIAWRFSNWLNN